MPTYTSLQDARQNRDAAYMKLAELLMHCEAWDITLTAIVYVPATGKVDVTTVQTLTAANRAHVGLA